MSPNGAEIQELSKKDLLDTLDLMGLLIESLREVVETNNQETYTYPAKKTGPQPFFAFTCKPKLDRPPGEGKPPFDDSPKPPAEPGLRG